MQRAGKICKPTYSMFMAMQKDSKQNLRLHPGNETAVHDGERYGTLVLVKSWQIVS
jgi:hypothetical protein